MPEVLPVGSVVEIISDSISHNIPIGSVVRISHWDGDQKEPVYEVEGYITHVWFTDVKLSDDQKQQTTEPTGPAAIGAGWMPPRPAQAPSATRESLFSRMVTAVYVWLGVRK